MNNLSSSERKYLRSQAHHLEPVVLIGKNGIKDGTIESINKVLQTRGLIKIKFREFKDEKVALSKSIAELTHSEVVGIIGHTLILFRQNPDSEKQQIHFPAKK
jgi:RNA-binding protein